MKRRLEKDAELQAAYTAVMQDYIKRGFAERVEEKNAKPGHFWFLPHHPVIHSNKPNKLRIVFDCAAKYLGVSLNEALMQGPDLLNSLVGVLTRFRIGLIAVVSDIEKMFHQVRVDPVDRSFLQFLWWPNGDLSRDPKTFRMTVHLFGATSSPSCASFCLKQSANLFDGSCSEATKTAIDKAFYVGDCLLSVDSVEEGAVMVEEMRHVLSSCGFHLTKWLSNKEEVLHSVPEEDRSSTQSSLRLKGNIEEQVLGVCWNVGLDQFQIKVNTPEKPCTKRGISSMSHSLFDPLGFVAPVLIEVKMLLRELKNYDWDDNLSDTEVERWKRWLFSLRHLSELKIPRCFKPPDTKDASLEYQLHHFGDASSRAYGAVSYLRIVYGKSKIHCAFVMGKSYLASLPSTTIPRMELLAAIAALRLDLLLKRELSLKITRTFFWLDTTAVLQSIYNSHRRFPVFVANRLAEIERNSNISSWRYVPTELNPADEASRGVQAEKFLTSSKWLTGPQFLKEPMERWPIQLEGLTDLPDEFPLFEKERKQISALLSTPEDPLEYTPIDKFVSGFSSLYRVKRAVAWLRKFSEFLKSHQRKEKVIVPGKKLRKQSPFRN